MSEHPGLLGGANLNGLWAHLNGDLGVFMGQFESVGEDFKVFLERKRVTGQLELIHLDELVQLGRMIDEDNFAAAFGGRQYAIVILGVLTHPRVHVYDVGHLEAFGYAFGQTAEPLRE